jgi:curved DNA-binding protein CbpA
MASAAPFDPFEALGLPRDASDALIKARYRELARKYHPNRQQGNDELKAALSERFHVIHQAYHHLVVPDKRRRYVELLRLAEEEAGLRARMADLLNGIVEQHTPHAHDHSHGHDGHVSSDADEDDLPRLGPLHRRRATLEQAVKDAKHLGDGQALGDSPKRNSSVRKDSKQNLKQSSENGNGECDYFSLRRKKLEKLRRKELAAFERYKNAMVEKFEAELEAEKRREAYENAQFKREYFERAPKETSERMRSFQHAMSAIRIFGSQPSRRRNRSTVSYGGQILSTEDAFETAQYLTVDNAAPSTSRSRPTHKRAWSSDISGDQTSSDEASSGGYATPRPGMGWTWHRHHSRNTLLDAFDVLSMWNANGTSKTSLPDHAPFQMVVKRPTGFTGPGGAEDQDSSPESTRNTPRSRSPALSDSSSNTYTLVNNKRMAEVLKSVLDGDRVQSPPVSGRHGPHNLANGTSDVVEFQIKNLGQSKFSCVPFRNVYELTYDEKADTLRTTQADVDIDSNVLMERLKSLDSNVADRFVVKPDIKERFRFRLIYHYPDTPKMPQNSSYIALSYRRQRHVEKKDGYFTLPLEPGMFQAVWDERKADTEGVWIDQISIDQESRVETTISMAAMDMVYRNARLIVVALDDLILEAHESSILESHMDEYAKLSHVAPGKRFRGKQPPYLDTHEELYQVLQKILRSSWFKRAWCRHEMRLARDHVFLVPCKSPGTWSGKSVVRFTSSCFTHLMALATEVPFEADIEKVKPALHAFFRDRSKLAPHERHLRFHHGNFTTVVAEVFGMEAGGDPRIPAKQRAADALKDKISIILNTMECGLALTEAMREPDMLLTKAECHYMLLIMALAAQDPGALCSVGPPMRLAHAQGISPLSPTAASTWLFEPTNVDSGLNNYRTLHRLPANALITTGLELNEHYVQLDLKFLKTGAIHRALDDPQSLELARRFTAVCASQKYGRNRQRYLITDEAANRHFGDMREVYNQTLACVFELGPDWVEDICCRYGVSRWRQDGEAAWNLLVALKNTNGNWPESAWSAQAAGFIMDFVNFLVIRGMPQRQIIHHEEWRPVWVFTETGGKVLTFIPPGQIIPAIPTALLDPDYVHLARLWVLEARTSFGNPSHGNPADATPSSWTLLGKSVLFSDHLALQMVHSQGGTWRDQQKVFGREDPEIERLLRERSLFASLS